MQDDRRGKSVVDIHEGVAIFAGSQDARVFVAVADRAGSRVERKVNRQDKIGLSGGFTGAEKGIGRIRGKRPLVLV